MTSPTPETTEEVERLFGHICWGDQDDDNAKRLTAERIQALKSRIADLEQALEPFATIANQYSDSEDDEFEIWRDFHPMVRELRITLGKFRKARAVLETKEGK